MKKSGASAGRRQPAVRPSARWQRRPEGPARRSGGAPRDGSKAPRVDADVVVVGGGAAGFFGALRARELNPDLSVLLLESAARPLGKVLISGGGRCNVTAACYDTERLLEHYPRGGRRLGRVLQRFGPGDTVEWFEARGVKLKTEADGRVFPVSDSSQTVVDCLLREARRLSVTVLTRHAVKEVRPGFRLETSAGSFRARKVLLAPGSSLRAYEWVSRFGHRVVPPVPSLFTFVVEDPRLKELQGVSLARVVGRLRVDPEIRQEGPLLVTHWGLSGPLVLRLSARGARALHEAGYRAELMLDFLPDLSQEELRRTLLAQKRQSPAAIGTRCPVELPRRLWQSLLNGEGIDPGRRWSEVPDRCLNRLSEAVKRAKFSVQGKGAFKEEFVTAGGVPLEEVDLDTMESRKVPGLHLAGELLDVDGLTGGFNFQNAWASGWVAGEALARL
ncbi:MAG: NAD(P)/FAD-dependent oxidoreductase [Armatimonadetes bacterium]|nr:NAD(P)/FAD-dependent oxidoreductase [Armatimonadota bacterium]